MNIMRKPVEYLALFFLLLVVGVYWGPWLGLHRSLALFSLSELVHLSQLLAQNLGGSMGFLLPACVGLMVISAWLYPAKRTGGFYLILLAIGFILASLGISVGIELPIVNQMKGWTPTTAPANWEALRDKWVYFTVVRMMTGLVAFLLFSAAILQPFRREKFASQGTAQ